MKKKKKKKKDFQIHNFIIIIICDFYRLLNIYSSCYDKFDEPLPVFYSLS